MQDHTKPRTKPNGSKMRVEIPCQQKPLKEKQTGIPNRRNTSDIGQNHFCGQRLNPEEQRGVDEDSDGVEQTQWRLTLVEFP